MSTRIHPATRGGRAALLALALAAVAAVVPASQARGATGAARAHAAQRDAPADVAADRGRLFLQWLRLDRRSGALYLGGTRFCATYRQTALDTPYCPPLLARSVDGGATWVDLSRRLGLAPSHAIFAQSGDHYTPTSAVVPANDGRHLYLNTISLSFNPHAGDFNAALVSKDAGLTWANLVVGKPVGAYTQWNAAALTASPADGARLYALHLPTEDESGLSTAAIATSADGAATWSSGAALPAADGYTIVPDTRSAASVYVALAGSRTRMLRSEDAGASWQPIVPPAGAGSFALSADPLTPGRLIGTISGAGVPADRRYLSDDGGRSWNMGTCPGDFHGVCPRFVVKNALGADTSYAFLPDGIYRFHYAGPAEERLPLSAGLPFPMASVTQVIGRGQPGDPFYVLTTGARGTVSGGLYRTLDGGKSWDNLLARALPNLAAPSRAPGTLYVRQTGHSVGAPFVGLYRTLGPALLGYPVTEPYAEGTLLTQDFEHLRLELRGGTATVAALSEDLLFPLASRAGAVDQAAVPFSLERPAPEITGPHELDAATHHLVQGAFLPFWRAHRSLLGAPLTEQFLGTNGDRSGRAYAMQYFANGRLELHPEITNPRYRVLLGLVGRDLWGFDRAPLS